MSSKYITTKYAAVGGESGHLIVATRDFGSVKRNHYGGILGGKAALAHDGNCWIYPSAVVTGNSKVYENAIIKYYSVVTGNSRVYGNAKVSMSTVTGDASICGDVEVEGAYIGAGAVIQSDKDFIVTSSNLTAYRGYIGIVVASSFGALPLDVCAEYMCVTEIEEFFATKACVHAVPQGALDMSVDELLSDVGDVDKSTKSFLANCNAVDDSIKKHIITYLTGWKERRFNRPNPTVDDILMGLDENKTNMVLEYVEQLREYEV